MPKNPKAIWEDVTTHWFHDREPHTFTLGYTGRPSHSPYFQPELTVYRHLLHPPNLWFVSMPGYFGEKQLKARTAEEAQKEAVEMARELLTESLETLP